MTDIFRSALTHFADGVIKHRSLLMSVAEAAGVFATFIFTIRANEKANELRHAAQAEKGENLTTAERIKAESSAYILPLAIATATTGVITINEICNTNEKKDLMNVVSGLSGLYFGRLKAEKEANVENQVTAELVKHKETPDIPDGYTMFYDPIQDTFFAEKWENIYSAEIDLERVYAYNGQAMLNDWYRALNNEKLPPKKKYDILGWTKWHTTVNDCMPPIYIDIYYLPTINEKGMEYYIIDFPNPPEPFL